MNRGIMRFSFVGVGSLRAFVSDVDTIGSFPSRADRPSGPREGRGVGRRPSRPGTFDIDGCSPRAWGQDYRPRTRDMSPAGVVGSRPRGIYPPGNRGCTTYQAVVPGGLSGDRLEGDAEDGGPAALGLAHAQAAAQGLHAAPRPLHVRPDEPQ